MRIIAGIYRGRKVKIPKSKLVRPTTDRTKESIFNYLNNIVDFDDIKVCDIYAGSGSLGLEALSRGAGEVHFIEKNYPMIKTLNENIESLDAQDKCRVIKTEAVKFSNYEGHETYDLILADPPFFKDDIHLVIANLLKNGYLNSNGLILVERSVQTEKKDVEAFGVKPFKKIGDSLIYQF